MLIDTKYGKGRQYLQSCSIVVKLRPLPARSKIIRIRRIRVKKGISVTVIWYKVSKTNKHDRPPKGIKTRATSIVYNLKYFKTFRKENQRIFKKLLKKAKNLTPCQKKALEF